MHYKEVEINMKTPKAIKEKMNAIFEKVSFRVQAEEQPKGEDKEESQQGGQSSTTPQTTTVNFEDLIANARKQEKDKLYPQIKKLEEENRKIKITNTF